MTSKEKADEIYSDCEDCIMELEGDEWGKCVKRCALIVVNEIMKIPTLGRSYNRDESQYDYWQEVKQEIINL